MSVVDRAILDRLEKAGVRHCLFGAVALAARGYARFSADRDLLTLDRAVLRPSFWSDMRPVPELRAGDETDPLVGVVRWPAPLNTDLIVGKGYAAGLAVSCAERLAGVDEPVPTALALVLCKLEAGGVKDQQDVVALIEAQRALGTAEWVSELPEHLGRCSPDAQELWERLRPSVLGP